MSGILIVVMDDKNWHQVPLAGFKKWSEMDHDEHVGRLYKAAEADNVVIFNYSFFVSGTCILQYFCGTDMQWRP